jgi:hypothetical protein
MIVSQRSHDMKAFAAHKGNIVIGAENHGYTYNLYG